MASIDRIAADLDTAGHPIRLKILAELAERGRTSEELAELLLLEPKEVGKHLARLRKDGWIGPDDHEVLQIRDRERLERVRRYAPEIFPRLPPLPEE